MIVSSNNFKNQYSKAAVINPILRVPCTVKHGRTHTVTTVMSNNCWQTLLTVTNRVANFIKLKYGTCSGEGEVGGGVGLDGWLGVDNAC